MKFLLVLTHVGFLLSLALSVAQSFGILSLDEALSVLVVVLWCTSGLFVARRMS